MRTFNGIGTMLYGWTHQPDGTSFATKWFVVFYVPFIPLKRYQLRVVTDLRQREDFVQVEREGFLAGVPTQRTDYALLRELPVSPGEVLQTLARTFLLGPVLLLWPAVLMAIFFRLTDSNPQWRDQNWSLFLALGLALLLMANVIMVSLVALRRARGLH